MIRHALIMRSGLVSFRKQIQLGLDLITLLSAFIFAYLLRFDFLIPPEFVHALMVQLPYVVLLQLTGMLLSGVYAFLWRYVGLLEVKSFVKSSLCSAIPLLLLRVGLPDRFYLWRVPFSVILIDAICAFGGVLVLRVLRRAVYEKVEKQRRAAGDITAAKRAVLLIGCGRAGLMAAKEIQSRGDIDLDIRGFIDDEAKKRRAVISGVRVLGTIQDLPRLVREQKIDHVIITIAHASREEMRRIVQVCEQIPIRVRIIPGLHEILQGKVEMSTVRDIRIEDLLGRESVQLNEQSLARFIGGKNVLVTGAGGSIGSELASQVARYEPARLTLVDRAENALFYVDRRMRELYPNQPIQSLIGDVCDEERMRTILNTCRPHLLLHAAAHKHVPLMEFNCGEAVKNNILGTQILATIAGESGVEVFVLVSTDKAVRPSSIMGATKRVAELVIEDLNRRHPTKYVAVRFGNVIGSTGSVVPLFLESIRNGKPLRITDKRMKRYFMTVVEAAQLVLQAGAFAESGTGGDVFVLHMGEPINILEMAEAMITFAGLRPHKDVEIIEPGIRPGEKLYEELLITEENTVETEHPKIFINKIKGHSSNEIHLALQRLKVLSKSGHEAELRLCLSELIPEAQLQRGCENGNRVIESTLNGGFSDDFHPRTVMAKATS